MSGSTLIATSRFRLLSLARYTSPIPPAPSGATISYESSRVPTASDIGGADYTLIQRCSNLPYRLVKVATGPTLSQISNHRPAGAWQIAPVSQLIWKVRFGIPKSSLSGGRRRGGCPTAESMASNERGGEVFGTLGG